MKYEEKTAVDLFHMNSIRTHCTNIANGLWIAVHKEKRVFEREREEERWSSINYAYDTLNEYTAKAVINSSRGFKQKKKTLASIVSPKTIVSRHQKIASVQLIIVIIFRCLCDN